MVVATEQPELLPVWAAAEAAERVSYFAQARLLIALHR